MDEEPPIQQYLKLRSEFMGYLYAMTKDVQLAEEVYQNAAVVVIEKSQASEQIRDFRAWAKEVVRRQALNALREKGKTEKHGRATSPDLLEAISEVFVQDESNASTVIDESQALEHCLEGLPTDKKELVALRYEGNRSFEEISSHLNSTPSAVRRALSRVRRMLQSCINRRMRLTEGAPLPIPVLRRI